MPKRSDQEPHSGVGMFQATHRPKRGTQIQFVNLDANAARLDREQLRLIRSHATQRRHANERARKRGNPSSLGHQTTKNALLPRSGEKSPDEDAARAMGAFILSDPDWKILSPARMDPFDTCAIKLKPYSECALYWSGRVWPSFLFPESVPELAVVQWNTPCIRRILMRPDVIHAVLAIVMLVTPAGFAVEAHPTPLGYEHRGEALRQMRQTFQKYLKRPEPEDVISLIVAITCLAPLEIYFGNYEVYFTHLAIARSLVKGIGGYEALGTGRWHVIECIFRSAGSFDMELNMPFEELGISSSITKHLQVDDLSVTSLSQIVAEIRSLQGFADRLHTSTMIESERRTRFDTFLGIRGIIDYSLLKLRSQCDPISDAHRQALILYMLVQFRKVPDSLEMQIIVAERIRVIITQLGADGFKENQLLLLWILAISGAPLRAAPQTAKWYIGAANSVCKTLRIDSFHQMKTQMSTILWPTQAEMVLQDFWHEIQSPDRVEEIVYPFQKRRPSAVLSASLEQGRIVFSRADHFGNTYDQPAMD